MTISNDAEGRNRGQQTGTDPTHSSAEKGGGGLLSLLRQSGPAFLASGLNIGSASVTNCVLLAAATGFLLGWVFVPATIAIYFATLACVKITIVSGRDPIDVMRTHLSPGFAWANGIAVLVVNLVFHLVNAVLGGLALNALFPQLSVRWWTVVAIAVTAMLALLPNRARFAERILKYFIFGLVVVYLVSLLVVPVDWGSAFGQMFTFTMPSGQSQVLLFTAALGAALAINVPMVQAYGSKARGFGPGQLRIFRFETAATNLLLLFVQFAVVVVVASTLFPAGIKVTSALEAGAALKPLAGSAATIVFAVGLLGACITTMVVQTSVAGYVVADLAGWRRDVSTPRFKVVQAAMLVIALTVPVLGFEPFNLTTWGAAFNSTFMPIGIGTWWLLLNRRAVMGAHRARWPMNAAMAVTMLIATVVAVRFWYVTLT